MSESLSEEELQELIRHGRISTSKSAAKRRRVTRRDESRPIAQRPKLSAEKNTETSTVNKKETDSEWLRTQKEKSERNIATSLSDKQRREEMREASKF